MDPLVPCKYPVEKPLASWTLYKQLTFSATAAVKSMLTNTTKESLDYYRFPFPELPTNARSKLSKLLSQTGNTECLERDYLRKLVDSWRRSLLHLWEALKTGNTLYFYYLQNDLVVLFGRKEYGDERPAQLMAYVARATKSLSTQLKSEGIAFETIGLAAEDPDADHEREFPEGPDSTLLESHGESEVESMDPKVIKTAIINRINHARKSQSKRRSVAPTSLKITGKTAVHSLVDFIINQRDGKSYVIMPEMIAPTPFLHGTLCKSEVTIVGPILGGEYQVKLSGILLPSTAQHFIDKIYESCNGERPFAMTHTLDDRTEPLLSIHL